MNSKEAKRYRKKAKTLTVEWIQSLIPDEEAKKVNVDNFQDYMPDQKYVYANKKFMLSAFSERWFYQKLKRLKKKLDSVTLKDFQNEEGL
tara:strand:+ start:400 stop:669 length:270 start_codon:yes stop_codon:yes gene_type:complete